MAANSGADLYVPPWKVLSDAKHAATSIPNVTEVESHFFKAVSFRDPVADAKSQSKFIFTEHVTQTLVLPDAVEERKTAFIPMNCHTFMDPAFVEATKRLFTGHRIAMIEIQANKKTMPDNSNFNVFVRHHLSGQVKPVNPVAWSPTSTVIHINDKASAGSSLTWVNTTSGSYESVESLHVPVTIDIVYSHAMTIKLDLTVMHDFCHYETIPNRVDPLIPQVNNVMTWAINPLGYHTDGKFGNGLSTSLNDPKRLTMSPHGHGAPKLAVMSDEELKLYKPVKKHFCHAIEHKTIGH